MYNIHANKNGTENPLKYFLCGIELPHAHVPVLNNNAKLKQQQKRHFKELQTKARGNANNKSQDLKRKIWNKNDQELSKWLLNDQIKCYFRLVENEVMRSDEDVLYMLHCIIDRFYRTWDDSFEEGYNIDTTNDCKRLLTLANANNNTVERSISQYKIVWK